MKKNDALDQEKNPDGIAIPLNGLDDEVWERGYYCETDDGTWYEVYANENIKEIWGDFELTDPVIPYFEKNKKNNNFVEELKKCGDELYKKNQYWEFIEANSSEIVDALSNVRLFNFY